MLKKILSLSLITLAATSFIATQAHAAPIVVNKSNCAKLVGTTKPFLLVLNTGDELMESITQCAKDADLMSASISGLGQLHNPTLAYFTSNPTDKPILTKLSGYYELASLNGNITRNENQHYTHAHVTLADKKFHGIAGHLNGATVGLTVEMTVVPLSGNAERQVDPKTGFGRIVNN